jgi:hypothetical protein
LTPITFWVPGVDPGLGAGRRLLDPHLRDALLDRLRHATGPLGLHDVGPGPLGEVVGEPLDVPGAAPGVDRAVVPLSCCSSSWVLRAIRAEKSVGSAIASSRALVCSDWVWPWVAAIASMQVRPTLLKTSCAVSDQPLVWLCVRRLSDLGFCGLELATSRAHSARAARILATSMKKFIPIAQKKLSRGANRSMSRPGVEPGADVLDAVGQRVGELEVGRRPGLLDVVAGDRDRVEPRHLLGGVAEDVGDDPHARRRRVDVGVADHELLEDVVLDGPRELLRLHPLLLGRAM